MSKIDTGALAKASRELGAAALDPTLWVNALETICEATGTTGAGVLRSDVQTLDQPFTPSARALWVSYVSGGWQARDPRARGVSKWMSGTPVLIDQDIFNPEIKSDALYYNDFLRHHGFQFFAGIGFWAHSSLWVLTLQRSPKDGPFDFADKEVLSRLSRQLTDVATLAKTVGYSVVAGMTSALELVEYPALVLDRLGFVLDVNAAAAALFDDEIRVRQRRLIIKDPNANAELEELIRSLRLQVSAAARQPLKTIIVRRKGSPMVIQALSVPAAARTPFLGATALLVFSDLGREKRPQIEVLKKAFNLSFAEAKLASLVAAGLSPQNAAEELGIARETARNHLKAVFAKTGTHRQGELVALLRKL
jgi:DNA-binding CsgD family transcriptional regulator